MNPSMSDQLGELGSRTSNSIPMGTTPGAIAQSDAERNALEAAYRATPDTTNAWVPDGYSLIRGADGTPYCVPQDAYIRNVSQWAPGTAAKAIEIAAQILPEGSDHKIAAEGVIEGIKSLLQTLNAHNMQFAVTRNLVYAFRNAVQYQAVVASEQLDQLQAQAARIAARGDIASDNNGFIRAREFVEQTVKQLYVVSMALTAFDPKDLGNGFTTQDQWYKTAASYCKKRGENFSKSVLHKKVDPKAANAVETRDFLKVASLIRAA